MGEQTEASAAPEYAKAGLQLGSVSRRAYLADLVRASHRVSYASDFLLFHRVGLGIERFLTRLKLQSCRIQSKDIGPDGERNQNEDTSTLERAADACYAAAAKGDDGS